jgi:predicted ester cyclase
MDSTVPGNDLEAFYRRYLQHCNDHLFDQLDAFVHEDVEVNGTWQGLPEYTAGLRQVVQAFPDYHWDLRHLFTDGDWISAHFVDTGTHQGTFMGVAPSSRKVSTQEFSVYRVDHGRIVEVWVAADNLHLLDQLR